MPEGTADAPVVDPDRRGGRLVIPLGEAGQRASCAPAEVSTAAPAKCATFSARGVVWIRVRRGRPLANEERSYPKRVCVAAAGRDPRIGVSAFLVSALNSAVLNESTTDPQAKRRGASGGEDRSHRPRREGGPGPIGERSRTSSLPGIAQRCRHDDEGRAGSTCDPTLPRIRTSDDCLGGRWGSTSSWTRRTSPCGTRFPPLGHRRRDSYHQQRYGRPAHRRWNVAT